MTPTDFEQQYREELRPLYKAFAFRLYTLLTELTSNAHIPVEQMEYRAKTTPSVLKKIERKTYADPANEIKDFAGVRIITYYLNDVPRITAMIRREFAVNEEHSMDKVKTLNPEEFGYRSVHLVITLAEPRSELNEWQRFAGLSAEIQVRSVLQHAWAVLSHTLDYKAESQIPDGLRRKMFRLSAQLEQADEDFQSLLMQADSIAEGYRADVRRGELNLPLDLDSLREFVAEKVDLARWERYGCEAGMAPFPQLVSKFQHIGLEILLVTLQAVGVRTIAEFEGLFGAFDDQQEYLRAFAKLVTAHDQAVRAVPLDVIIILVSLVQAASLPAGFDWGGKYDAVFIEALRTVCAQAHAQ